MEDEKIRNEGTQPGIEKNAEGAQPAIMRVSLDKKLRMRKYLKTGNLFLDYFMVY